MGINNRMAVDNRHSTEERSAALRCAGVQVEEVWECDVIEELKTNRQMRDFFEDATEKGPIDARMAYSGGRTGPLAMFAQAEPGTTEISMADVVSLYPVRLLNDPVISPFSHFSL